MIFTFDPLDFLRFAAQYMLLAAAVGGVIYLDLKRGRHEKRQR